MSGHRERNDPRATQRTAFFSQYLYDYIIAASQLPREAQEIFLAGDRSIVRLDYEIIRVKVVLIGDTPGLDAGDERASRAFQPQRSREIGRERPHVYSKTRARPALVFPFIVLRHSTRTARQRYRPNVQPFVSRIVPLVKLHFRDAPLACSHVFNVGHAPDRKRSNPADQLPHGSHFLAVDGCYHVAALQPRLGSRARLARKVSHDDSLAAGNVVQPGDLWSHFLRDDTQEPTPHSPLRDQLIVDIHSGGGG